ncbi:hypothetical protein Tco_0907515 [Tanacetum coccineum]|uniref:Uncharacterized protein n=1 Tax=Tanacetum coccineum TaxID=301880 RepID=A0ABQ5CJI8_9ASTR
MSPYQSDNDDDEEDDQPTKKFIPSWCSSAAYKATGTLVCLFLLCSIANQRKLVNSIECASATSLREKISLIDIKAKIGPLTSDEVMTRAMSVKELANLEYSKAKDLRKKSKSKWALEGDKNSRFFHGIINNNMNHSRINGLNIQGSWVTDPTCIKNHILHSFELKFKKDKGRASRTTSSSKSLRWDFIGGDILSFVKEFETTSSIPRGCNSSFFTLVPKVEDPIVIEVGVDKVHVSHLQFVDDALILGDWSKPSNENLYRILTCLHIASGFKVNFSKSSSLAPWRFLIEDNALWCKVIRSIHGSQGGLHDASLIRSKSGPWYRIGKLNEDLLNDYGINLPLIFEKEIGNGESTHFWLDNWLGGPTLKETFPHIFWLDNQPNCLVCDRVPDNNGLRNENTLSPNTPVYSSNILPINLRFNWAWTRPIRSNMEHAAIMDISNMVANLVLSPSCDIWECVIDDTRSFSVKGLRTHITNTAISLDQNHPRWNKTVDDAPGLKALRVPNQNLLITRRTVDDEVAPWLLTFKVPGKPAAKKAPRPAVGKKADVPSQNKNVREDVDRAEMIIESRLRSLIPQTDLLVTWHLAQSESHNATTLKPLFLFEN